MSIYGEPSHADFLPAYFCNPNYMDTQRQQKSICRGILSHLFAMVVAIGLCAGGYYYYQNIYVPKLKEQLVSKNEQYSTGYKKSIKDSPQEILQGSDNQKTTCVTKNVVSQLYQLKESSTEFEKWRKSVNAYISKIQSEQDMKIQNAINEALNIYEADGIGLMDYAASYAGGMIVGLSKETNPHPTHRPLSLLKIVNVDVLSSPEELIRPCVLPGSCFAFRYESGAVRIKLGKPIAIGGVTLSHASKFLLGTDGMRSAPKEFEVNAFTGPDDQIGTFLGKFKYDSMGEQHQTFAINKNMSKNELYEEVELVILNNYGKKEFTCVYRFRVHRSEMTNKFTQTKDGAGNKKKSKTCC